MSEPTEIYLIEQRNGPTRNGPWSEWSSTWNGLVPLFAYAGPQVSLSALPAAPQGPCCLSIGDIGEVWQELRCIPFRRVIESVVTGSGDVPIACVLYCQACGKQHLDVLEADGTDWSKRPHKLHLCKNTPDGPDTGCGHLWTPYTVGVKGT